VIIAEERAKRPSDFITDPPPNPPSFDPFAEGNESKTPPEIMAYREAGTAPNGPGWRVRVVPNRYPALQIEGELNKRGHGLYDTMHGVGAHEVIIETPKCLPTFSSLPDEHVQEIFWMYRDRLIDLARDPRLQYGTLFKNVGRAAGATLYHTHSQLIATPIVPRTIGLKQENCEDYYRFRGRCLLCDMTAQELEQKSRIVLDSGQFLAFQPYAARLPFETMVVPKQHLSHYEHLNRAQVEELAFLMKRVLGKIEKGLGMPAYNYMLFTMPFHSPPSVFSHWHIEITPRLVQVAGFEWGSGFHINPVPPEDAAVFLRNVKL
jgi:UDPglucose--hexose-1-phosphate uridylyltransferase